MAFKMTRHNLYDYDVYPKVVRAGVKTCITVRPLGARCPFEPGRSYKMIVKAIAGGRPSDHPASASYKELTVPCEADGCLRFENAFETEQEYLLDIYSGEQRLERFSVYCVEKDLWGMYPFIGDLHMHTTRSDGSQNPVTVCANYRRYGYDFMVVSDHTRYYPSLEAKAFYANVPTELNIVAGEEVHMPRVKGMPVAPHVVNFGGRYSVNALVERPELDEWARRPENRSLDGSCPEIMTQEQWDSLITSLAEKTEVPADVDAVPAAALKWIYDEIRRAGGLAIYPHPMWISDTFHVPDAMHKYIVENRLFDAFEVLGGENYFEQNGYQTVQYYEDRARGYNYPVVGSTDSHSSNPTNRNALICSTIVFAPENTREALIDSVKAFRSVAVDTISTEFRLVGEMRYVRYGCFLLNNYFPLHDEVCYEEGRLMKQVANGTEEEKQDALKTLSVMFGRVGKMMKKYFDI